LVAIGHAEHWVKGRFRAILRFDRTVEGVPVALETLLQEARYVRIVVARNGVVCARNET
jgi:hypothetical protein